MPRKCSICSHPKQDEIDEALALRRESFRDIAGRFSVNRTSLHRHFCEHLPTRIVLAQEASERIHAGNLLDKVLEGEADTNEIREACKEALRGNGERIKITEENRADAGLLLRALAQRDRTLELYARIIGKIRDMDITFSISESPAWLKLKAKIFLALKPFPDALQALEKFLADGEITEEQRKMLEYKQVSPAVQEIIDRELLEAPAEGPLHENRARISANKTERERSKPKPRVLQTRKRR